MKNINELKEAKKALETKKYEVESYIFNTLEPLYAKFLKDNKGKEEVLNQAELHKLDRHMTEPFVEVEVDNDVIGIGLTDKVGAKVYFRQDCLLPEDFVLELNERLQLAEKRLQEKKEREYKRKLDCIKGTLPADPKEAAELLEKALKELRG